MGHFTCWPDAVPIANMIPETVANAFVIGRVHNLELLSSLQLIEEDSLNPILL